MIADSNAQRTIPATVRTKPGHRARGSLSFSGRCVPCALGRSGGRALKREGDGATPFGQLPVREAFYRSDRQIRPTTPLGLRALRPDWGWCDAPTDRNYNRKVRLPYPSSAESLWREDALYDIIVVLGYNDRPRRRYRGSAIFLHIAPPGYTPTEGCIAISLCNMRALLRVLRPGTLVHIMR